AASRVTEFISSKGAYAYGGYPEIDDLVQQQSVERDVKKREALLHRIQQMTIDRVMFAPIMDLRALMGIGPKMADHTINLVPKTWGKYVSYSGGNLQLEGPDKSIRIVDLDGKPPEYPKLKWIIKFE